MRVTFSGDTAVCDRPPYTVAGRAREAVDITGQTDGRSGGGGETAMRKTGQRPWRKRKALARERHVR